MSQHEKINYIEFPSSDMGVTKNFFSSVFAWKFTDYGPDYTAIENAGIDGGFYKADKTMSSAQGSALIIFYSINLEQTMFKVDAANGKIVKAIFDFPGGRRFHFTDPNNNEFAVWSDR